MLGIIHARIGGLEQTVRRCLRILGNVDRIVRNAETNRYRNPRLWNIRRPCAEFGAFDAGTQSFRDRDRVILGTIEQRDAKLIAAVATGEAASRRDLAKYVGKRTKQRVANRVTEGTVPQFKTVMMFQGKSPFESLDNKA